MPAFAELLAVIAAQHPRVRTGLEVGFDSEETTDLFRKTFGGLWLSAPMGADFRYADAQFEVVVLNGDILTREGIREAHRVLKPRGCAFFTVKEQTRKQEGHTLASVYRLVREGFDIIAVKRPRWWFLGRKERTLTFCLRKKAWRAAKSFIRSKGLVFTPFRERT